MSKQERDQKTESGGWQIGFCFSSSDWMFYIFGDWSVVMEAMSELVASAVVDSIALYSFSINEDSFGWQPAARRGADCGSIAASDAEHCACPAGEMGSAGASRSQGLPHSGVDPVCEMEDPVVELPQPDAGFVVPGVVRRAWHCGPGP